MPGPVAKCFLNITCLCWDSSVIGWVVWVRQAVRAPDRASLGPPEAFSVLEFERQQNERTPNKYKLLAFIQDIAAC